MENYATQCSAVHLPNVWLGQFFLACWLTANMMNHISIRCVVYLDWKLYEYTWDSRAKVISKVGKKRWHRALTQVRKKKKGVVVEHVTLSFTSNWRTSPDISEFWKTETHTHMYIFSLPPVSAGVLVVLKWPWSASLPEEAAMGKTSPSRGEKKKKKRWAEQT